MTENRAISLLPSSPVAGRRSRSVSRLGSARAYVLMCWINYLKETNGLKIFLTGWQAASRSSKRVHLREHLMTRRKKEFSERYARTSRTTSKNPSCKDLKICSAG